MARLRRPSATEVRSTFGFFFSSRRRHTSLQGDWSSDVCSSDLEISMLDNLSDGRLEIGVGRGGVMEAFFWGQEADPETNYARYLETLDIIRTGLSHDELTYAGRFHSFEKLPMYLRPLQRPYPPLWYMRNPVTAAREGMHTIIVGSLDGLAAAVPRYRAAWDEHQGAGARTVQGDEPMIGLV